MACVAFNLAAPLVSWAEAGSAVRPTDSVPTWSAVVGMMGAALGLRRGDSRLFELARDYALAVEVQQAGRRLEDYHTVQTPKRAASAVTARTRGEELALDLQTSITRREYVAGAVYRIFIVTMAPEPCCSPASLATALRSPFFPLSAGRRSCLVGNVAAIVVDGELDEALRDATHWDARIKLARPYSMIRERRDMPVAPRVFDIRLECMA